MKFSRSAAVCAAMAWLMVQAAAPSRAAVTTEEADHLGQDLTAIGAEKAGNADGSIPAWEGGEAPAPGWHWGKAPRWSFSRYKDEKPLYSIDASNLEKYAARLTVAQRVAIRTIAGYRMDVYPSHRSCNIDPGYAERSRQNATEALIGADGWTLQHAKSGGVPFPVPKSGVEALYNSRMKAQGIGYRVEGANTVISPIPGNKEFTTYVWDLVDYAAAQNVARASLESDSGVEFYLHYKYQEPAALKGQALIALSFVNKAPEQYYYFPGQRRVRRLPNYVFDTPVVGYENQYLNDEQFLLWSTLDRFDYKLVGKQEVYIAYNALKMYDFDAKVADVYGKSFVNPDYRRFELHRVWVVDAKLKPGFKHVVPHRVYYLDEDSWAIAAVTEYDEKGRTWKLMESALMPIWELGGSCSYGSYLIWDLLGGRYVSDFSLIGTHHDIKWVRAGDPEAADPEFRPEFYTPETLRAISER